MDRPALKIEVPLPRWPRSPVARFSIRGLLLGVAVIALGLTTCKYATEQTKSTYEGGQFHLVISTPDTMVAKNRLCIRYASILELARSPEIRFRAFGSELSADELWPPKVWIKRADWEGTDLEKTIVVHCSGTVDDPVIDSGIPIKPGDRVFFDYGRPRVRAASS